MADGVFASVVLSYIFAEIMANYTISASFIPNPQAADLVSVDGTRLCPEGRHSTWPPREYPYHHFLIQMDRGENVLKQKEGPGSTPGPKFFF